MNGEEIMDNIKKLKNNDFPLWYWKGFFHRMVGQEFCSEDNVEESLSSRLRRSKGSSRYPQQSYGSGNSSKHGRIPNRVGAGVLAGGSPRCGGSDRVDRVHEKFEVQ
ncbi:hypothetical protein NC652_038814 [Populus alba x Populus x berolinensis]|nr:hypothetical protein NC652_038814 [Populus alba x Populus x berolinensis]